MKRYAPSVHHATRNRTDVHGPYATQPFLVEMLWPRGAVKAAVYLCVTISLKARKAYSPAGL